MSAPLHPTHERLHYGASELKIVTRVVVLVITPALASLGLLWFIYMWNDFFWPLLALNTPIMYTIQVGIYPLLGLQTDVSAFGSILAGWVVATAPIVVLFLLLERRFIAGIAEGAIT